MKIAIAGIRGIPANYGGFETFAEEISARLVQSGYSVRVYCRSHCYSEHPTVIRGASLVYLPAVRHKYLETILHTLLSLIHLLFHPVDCLLVCNAANSPFIWIARLRGIPVVVNVDGVERKRAKWNILGKAWYRLGELCSVLFANVLVADAECIREYYLSNYHTDSRVIPYGFREKLTPEVDRKVADGVYPFKSQVFDELKIRPGHYLLYVARLEPENNAHVVIRAYGIQEFNLPLVIVGGAPYAREYGETLRKEAGNGVIFAGYRFGEEYEALQFGAKIYLQAGEVGGTHPALVEAMGFGNAIIANDTPEHREVLAETGLFYSKNSVTELASAIDRLLLDDPIRLGLSRAARNRAKQHYSWESVVKKYIEIFEEYAKKSLN